MAKASEPRNLMEELVPKAYDELIKEYPGACNCIKCRNDAIALALNRLGPKYVSSSQGEVRTMALELEARQRQIDIWLALRKAIEQVAATPHHQRN